jgi:hypothetical protein
MLTVALGWGWFQALYGSYSSIYYKVKNNSLGAAKEGGSSGVPKCSPTHHVPPTTTTNHCPQPSTLWAPLHGVTSCCSSFALQPRCPCICEVQ